jgi:hypothetical protein
MQDEILNIDYHIERMLRKAIEISCCRKSAAKKLGITERCLYDLMGKFKIKKKGDKTEQHR